MSIKAEYYDYLDHFGTTVTLDEYRNANGPAIALRHDIDYCIDTALEMAFWESERGIRATYFLLHTTPYWNDGAFIAKCAQLVAFGHELGLHTNLLRPWFDTGIDPEQSLALTLARLRESGAVVRGTAAHGDPLCYRRNFINYWVFSELRPADPPERESSRNAEGILEPDPAHQISYPAAHCLETDGRSFPLWSIGMSAHGLEYEASHLEFDAYFSDSGGRWKRTGDPLETDLTGKRCQILVHPIHWRDTPRAYFFLSTARSGSKWLAHLLDTASSCRGLHEYTLNHIDGADGHAIEDKRTAASLHDLLADGDEIERRLAHTSGELIRATRDIAEANVYLPLVLPALEKQFPDATLVHLHRNPKDVARSLMTRGWYDTPDDTRHPRCSEVANWDQLSQLTKCCHYIAHVHQLLLQRTDERLSFERMVSDISYLRRRLRDIGIAFYPVLATHAFDARLNENTLPAYPAVEAWTSADQASFRDVCGAIMHTLGYEFSLRAAPRSVWNAVHEFLTETLPGWLHRVGPRSRPLLECGSASAFHNYVSGVNCAIEIDSSGLAFTADREDAHASILIGTKRWGRLAEGQGWHFPSRGYLAAQLDFSIGPAVKATMFALMYDDDGKLMYRRTLGTLTPDATTRRFTFARLGNWSRFALALYLPRQQSERTGCLQNISLRIHDR